MKKVLIAMLVSAAAVTTSTTASETEAGIWHLSNYKTASENVLFTASAVTVFEIQQDNGPAYVLCLENAAQPSLKKNKNNTYSSIINLLPEPMTISLLGLSGFLMRRRNTT